MVELVTVFPPRVSCKRRRDASTAAKESHAGDVDSLPVDGLPVAAKDVQYAIASLDRTASLVLKAVKVFPAFPNVFVPSNKK